MICKKCGATLTETANFCHVCGKPVKYTPTPKKRGNGTGSVYKTKSGKWLAIVTLGYYIDEDGKRHRRTRSKVFDRKTEAVNALATLQKNERKEQKKTLTFKQLYDLWYPTHQAGVSTLKGYKYVFKHFAPIYHMKLTEIELDDLQECIDNCPAGKRTRQLMRDVVSLSYKYGIPRHMIPENLNLAPFLSVTGESAAHRDSFTETQIKKIRIAASKGVPYADYIYIMIYTGFRPAEFFALSACDYDKANNCIIGGAKTDAGKNRRVTISPKIETHVNRLYDACTASTAPLFPDSKGKRLNHKTFPDLFYDALEQAGIDNPMIEIAGGVKRHKYTPHSCRHTFSTLLKRVAGADKDKLELIGHASGEMLRYYQDIELTDLKKITDAI